MIFEMPTPRATLRSSAIELMGSGLGSVPPNPLVYCMRLFPAASKSRRNPSPDSAEKA